MREKINKLAKGNIDDVKPLIRVIPERLDFVTQKGELIKADVLIKTDNHVPMKALAYSRDPRVKVVTPSFGGETAVLRLQFNYAVYDTEGSFSGEIELITNGGELKLPYTVTIQQDKRDKFFSELASIDDFEKIVRADGSAALRLFNYKNFPQAAFMQDPVVYMLYSTFSGRPDKMLAMRQFILAVRKYVSGKASGGQRWADDTATFAATVERSETAASAAATATAGEEHSVGDGTAVASTDAEAVGKTARAASGTEETDKDTTAAAAAGAGEKTSEHPSADSRRHGQKYYFAKYYRARLDYEIGEGKDKALLKEMESILDAMSAYEQDEPCITLLKAENALLSGDTEKAAETLNTVRSKIQNNRQQYLDEYFLLEYINCEMNGDNSRRASYIRLLHKFITEEKKYHLFMYLVRVDDALKEDDTALYVLMHKLYEGGYRSPVLYLEYVRFLNAHPDYLHDPTDLDMHALFFGSRNDMLSAQLITELTNRASLLNLNNILYYPIFTSLYKKTQSKVLLQAVCSTLIRADRRDKSCHYWYALGVEADAKINGLYEYYLYSMPSQGQEIAEAVLVHFSRGDNLDAGTRAKLYAYVVRTKDANTLLYRVYEPKIRAYTLAALRERHISSEMVVLYRYLLSSGTDLEEYYEYLPEILSTYRYSADSGNVRAVVALYPQLKHEQVFSIDENRNAYVPVISEDMIVLTQDAYGNRYCDTSLTRERLFEADELMDICRLRCPDNLIVQLLTVEELSRKECTLEDQVRTLEHVAVSLPLSRPYKAVVDRKLIDFYDSEYSRGFKSGYMQDIRKEELDRTYRSKLVDAQIRAGLWEEAFSGICMDGFSQVDSDQLRELCDKLIHDEPVKQREQLLQIAYETILRKKYDKITLDYLCEHFNGSSADMYDVLEKSISEGIDTCDLEERLLAQLIFVDDTKMIDQVFTWYVERKRASEQLIKAYFTIRTYRYFLQDEPTDASVFEYIESVIKGLPDPTGLPIIHQFALTRFYSELEECTQEQIRIADVLIHSLFLKGYAFPYFKRFARYFELPGELKDDVMAVYRAKGSAKPYVMTRLEPAETELKLDTMKRMYKSLYVLDKILFDDEKLYYEIYEVEDGIDTLEAQGTLEPDRNPQAVQKDRFDCLNEMIRDFGNGDEVALRRNMDSYLVGSRLASKLFNRK